jgi:hypothetical protein
MTAREYIIKNNDLLIHTTQNVSKGYDNYMELYQSVVEQILIKPDTMDNVDDEKKLFFFIKVIKNNYYSNTSRYQYKRQKYKDKNVVFKEELNQDIPDIVEEETYPDWDWVLNELEQMDWFDRDLFLLWAQLGTLTAVNKETTIPINSVGKYIKSIKLELQKRWINTR